MLEEEAFAECAIYETTTVTGVFGSSTVAIVIKFFIPQFGQSIYLTTHYRD